MTESERKEILEKRALEIAQSGLRAAMNAIRDSESSVLLSPISTAQKLAMFYVGMSQIMNLFGEDRARAKLYVNEFLDAEFETTYVFMDERLEEKLKSMKLSGGS